MRIFVIALIAFVTLQQVSAVKTLGRTAARLDGRVLRGFSSNGGAPLPPFMINRNQGSSTTKSPSSTSGASSAKRGRLLKINNNNSIAKLFSDDHKAKAKAFVKKTSEKVHRAADEATAKGKRVLEKLMKM